MKKIKFHLGIGYAGVYREEMFEFEDNAADEEIMDAFQDWQDNCIDAAWWEVEDEE